ncbi:hypothetical protein HY772_06660 [Candidatus Woesearchaeota archaeon]|nr:hypothetical protein [Candidatus Woesearchaeota archaeon]
MKKNGIKKLLLLFLVSVIFLVPEVHAHCPLCTAGAAAAAAGAVWLGVSSIVVSFLIGAFAVSTGWWFSKFLKKKYIPFQRAGIVTLAFVTTVVPLMPIMSTTRPVFISLAGDYGSLLNRTYLVNYSLVASIIGGLIVCITPWLSSLITKKRAGKQIPYQGIMLTFLFLSLGGVFIQLVIA